MVNLEKLNYSSDSGAEAIQKLDRNQRAIASEVNEMDVDAHIEQHNTSEESHKDIREQINVLSEKVPFTCTAGTGYEIITQNCFTLNGIHFIDVEIEKDDDSILTDTNGSVAFTIPFTPTIYAQPLSIAFLDARYGDYSTGVFGFCNIAASKKCYYQLCNSTQSTKIMRISGVIF